MEPVTIILKTCISNNNNNSEYNNFSNSINNEYNDIDNNVTILLSLFSIVPCKSFLNKILQVF